MTTLAPPLGYTSSMAMAINELGDVVGQATLFDGGSNGGFRAVKWPAGSSAIPLDLPPNAVESYATDINNGGEVVGSYNNALGTTLAALWRPDGRFVSVAPLHADDIGSSAENINEAGQIVGSVLSATGGEVPVLWSPGAQALTPIDMLPGAATCSASGINNLAQVVGTCVDPSPSSRWRGFFWSQATGLIELPGLPGVSENSTNPIRINDRGEVSGSLMRSDGQWEAVTWSVSVNRPPVARIVAPSSGNEGTAILFDGSKSSDPDNDALIYAWDFDGDGVTDATTPTASHVFPDNGTYSVRLTVSDDFSSSSTDVSIVTVNVAPTGQFIVPATVNEGTPITLSLLGQDAAGDLPSLQYAFDCGDGAGYSPFGHVASRACPTVDNEPAPRTVRAQVRDKDGALASYTANVSVVNVAPVAAITAIPTRVAPGAVFDVTGRFTDAGVNDGRWKVQIDWDLDDPKSKIDGGLVTSQGTYTVPTSYKQPGVYRVQFWVTDKDAASGYSTIATISVCDPKRENPCP
jgi:uncharacterized membrane protein